ncbi:MAG: hypothetical protein WDW36_002629 [Sanguina aurantia]
MIGSLGVQVLRLQKLSHLDLILPSPVTQHAPVLRTFLVLVSTQGPDPTHFPGGFTVALQEELAQDAALHKGQPADVAWMNNPDA